MPLNEGRKQTTTTCIYPRIPVYTYEYLYIRTNTFIYGGGAYLGIIWVCVGIVCCGGVAALTGFRKDKGGKYDKSF